ncbi:MAG: hypothetical protein MJ002_06025 [Paludibacteraceae bacterium]|nr:hypothetical protein [Paludibacteraceae bacterium]
MRLPSDTLRYIISFLLCSDRAGECSLVAYTANPSEYKGYPLAIVPDACADVTCQLPFPKVSCLDGLPIFHGKPCVSRDGDTIVLHADIIATTFYLLSRYDEYSSKASLDIHSRFLPENSLLGGNNLLETPILDLYTGFIYRLLDRPKPHRRSHIYLTHDIDSISYYRSPRGFVGGLLRSLRGKNPDPLSSVFKSLRSVENDPAYTFGTLSDIDSLLPDAEVVYFVKPDNIPHARLDRPLYRHSSPGFKTLTHLPMGLHSLYYTYDHPDTLKDQVSTVSRLPNHNTYHRSHYLRILPPQRMHLYSDAGITDDFSLAYASAPGFRLGTTRPSRAIDPSNGQLLPLTLHPLTLMDTSLSDSRYLNLNEEEAYTLATSLIDTTLKYEGDITLLFHNTSFRPSAYHQSLYTSLIKHLI